MDFFIWNIKILIFFKFFRVNPGWPELTRVDPWNPGPGPLTGSTPVPGLITMHVGQCFHDLGFSAFFGFWCSIFETLIISLFYLFIFTVHASYHIFLFLMDHWLDVVTYKMARFLIHQSQVNFFVVLWSCFHQIKKVFWKDFFS